MNFRLSWLILLIATALACDFSLGQTTQPAGDKTASQPTSTQAASQPSGTQVIPAPPSGTRERDRGSRRRSRDNAPSETAPASAPAGSWNSYSVLASRNIFVQDRSRLRSRSNSSQQDNRDSDSYMILTGTVEQGPYQFAFIEDTRTGATARLMAGQAAGKGQVISVTLDGIEYANAGSIKTIFVGQNLTGETILPTGAATTAPTASSQPSDASGGEVNSVLERLRQRRAQEMNQ